MRVVVAAISFTSASPAASPLSIQFVLNQQGSKCGNHLVCYTWPHLLPAGGEGGVEREAKGGAGGEARGNAGGGGC